MCKLTPRVLPKTINKNRLSILMHWMRNLKKKCMNNVTFTITYLAEKVDNIINVRYEITLIFGPTNLNWVKIGHKNIVRFYLNSYLFI